MSPEPVGSTHLRFGDARVVEILAYSNRKVVRSPDEILDVTMSSGMVQR